MLYWGMRYGFRGVAFASMGVATGLFFLIGFYVLGWLGAGDVKVFAALGAILGAHNIMVAGLFGLMVGGLLCVLYLDEQGPRWHLLPAGKALNYARKTGKTVPLGAALAAGALMTQMGIFVFSLAFMSRQLLGNLAAETARQCVARSANGQGAVESCVQPLGSWLAAKVPILCLGGPVRLSYSVQQSGIAGLSPSATYQVNEPFLVVAAYCTWTFVPGKTVLGSSNTLPMPDSDILKGIAAVPYTLYTGGA
ncbi:hypothetical protein Q3G72_019662 [Acer saccharum]|nr:hypothetical protein Q3G72_019662 [Acer saccharum]